jgi:hypothetical protein
MPAIHDDVFLRQRGEAFDRVIALLESRVKAATPSLLLQPENISPDSLRTTAEKESWSLFLRGVQHLKDGAPGGGPGAMTEALARTSLRASDLAAALGVRPPQFEPLYFNVDYTTGAEAVLFYCRRLAEAAAGDFPKSRQIIQQKILAEKPPAGELKTQMALSFDVLAETYERICREFLNVLN